LGEGGPSSRPPLAASPWLLHQWRQRGIVPSNGKLTQADFDALKQGSWFLRRNRKSPMCTSTVASHAASVEGKRTSSRPGNSVLAAIQARLPTPTQQASDLPRMPNKQLSAEDLCRPQRGAAPIRLCEIAEESEGTQPLCQVYLTIYDLCPCWNVLGHTIGLGVYHSGVEVDGVEYTFDNHGGDGSGLVWHAPYFTDPSFAAAMPLRARLPLGCSPFDSRQGHRLLREMRTDWPSQAYDLLENNCHHFTAAAADVLEVCAVPRWVNRTGEILRIISGAAPAERTMPTSANSRTTVGFAECSFKQQKEQECECEPLLASSSQRLHLP